MPKHDRDPLERIAASLEWLNAFLYYHSQQPDSGEVTAFGTGPPPPPPTPTPQN